MANPDDRSLPIHKMDGTIIYPKYTNSGLISRFQALRIIPIDLMCFEVHPETLQPISDPKLDHKAVSYPTHETQIPVSKWIQLKEELKAKQNDS